MGDIARCSLKHEKLLYKLFGVNAELLIDHAWGWEPCTIADIKNYRPESSSTGSGQVLHCAYDFEKARVIVMEMTDLLVLDLVEKGLVTDQIVLTVGYDRESLMNPEIRRKYTERITLDHYGREIPKHAHGSVDLRGKTSSSKKIIRAVMALYDRIVNPDLLVRRVTVVANHIIREEAADLPEEQLNFFSDADSMDSSINEKREKRRQYALLDIRRRYGKNAILKGMNYREGATTQERNQQIGGHKA